MSTHTPGPWLGSNRTLRTHNHPERYWERHVHANDDLVLVGTASGAGPEEAEANARLIAAAPDMLAALVAILELGRKNTSNSKYDGFYDDAIAAIAKAKGQS